MECMQIYILEGNTRALQSCITNSFPKCRFVSHRDEGRMRTSFNKSVLSDTRATSWSARVCLNYDDSNVDNTECVYARSRGVEVWQCEDMQVGTWYNAIWYDTTRCHDVVWLKVEKWKKGESTHITEIYVYIKDKYHR